MVIFHSYSYVSYQRVCRIITWFLRESSNISGIDPRLSQKNGALTLAPQKGRKFLLFSSFFPSRVQWPRKLIPLSFSTVRNALLDCCIGFAGFNMFEISFNIIAWFPKVGDRFKDQRMVLGDPQVSEKVKLGTDKGNPPSSPRLSLGTNHSGGPKKTENPRLGKWDCSTFSTQRPATSSHNWSTAARSPPDDAENIWKHGIFWWSLVITWWLGAWSKGYDVFFENQTWKASCLESDEFNIMM